MIEESDELERQVVLKCSCSGIDDLVAVEYDEDDDHLVFYFQKRKVRFFDTLKDTFTFNMIHSKLNDEKYMGFDYNKVYKGLHTIRIAIKSFIEAIQIYKEHRNHYWGELHAPAKEVNKLKEIIEEYETEVFKNKL